ncbi:VOC family protein [Nocardia panacis]|uniref:VOC family protein n=1 Tax=Nocardia panacis TaxID=2340916 RepID=A0A3A4KKC6_9NOCA|nr:VOC family protein [Nocardia panacis]RJO73437.1 VOC family protein [Nocardia panacis]
MSAEITSFHHIGLLSRDLDGMAAKYESLGFTLSPRSRHMLAARPGARPTPSCTANQCVLFGGSYLELLGIVDESAPDQWQVKPLRDGLQIINFDTDAPEALRERLAAAGVAVSGVLGLEREVDTEDGAATMRAKAMHVDPRTTPEGLLGFAQHLTRELVHQPRYLDHANGALGLTGVTAVIDDADFDSVVDRYGRILDTAPLANGPRTVVARKDIRMEFVRRSDATLALPAEPVPATTYLAATTIRVAEVEHARAIVEKSGTPTRSTDGGFLVSARDAYGTALRFVA